MRFQPFDGGAVGLVAGESTEADRLVGWSGVDEIVFEAGWEVAQSEADARPWPDATARHVLPVDLEEIPPGLFLYAVVTGVDRRRLSGRDQVRLLQARNRLVSHLEGDRFQDTTRIFDTISGEHPDLSVEESWDAACMEIAAALTKTRRASNRMLGHAQQLTAAPGW